MDFAIELVSSVFNLPNMQVMFFLRNLNNRRTVKSILLVKKFLGPVEMMPGLVNANFSFAPCPLFLYYSAELNLTSETKFH